MAEGVGRRADAHGAVLLRLLRDHGPLTKTELAELAGVSRSTVNAAVLPLVDAGVVENAETAASTGGRRSTPVRLASALRLLAISFGAARIHVGLTDGRLEPVALRSFDRDPGWSADGEADHVAARVRDLLDEAGVARPRAVGVAAPVWQPGGEAELGRRMAERLGERPVVGRAASAMALGERHAGAGRGSTDLVVVRLGVTVTMAAVVDGRLVEGASGLAGDIGHYRVEDDGPPCCCGSRGCLDSWAGGPAVLRHAEEAVRRHGSALLESRLARGPLSLEDLIEAAVLEDAVAVRVARGAGRRVGRALAAVAATTNPERILLGGILAGLGPELLTAIRAEVSRSVPAGLRDGLSVELGRLGDRAGLVGAAHLASDDLFDRVTAPAPSRAGSVGVRVPAPRGRGQAPSRGPRVGGDF